MWRGHNEEAKRGPPCRPRITRNSEGMMACLLRCVTPGLSRSAGWCVMDTTREDQPRTPVWTLLPVRDGLPVLCDGGVAHVP